MNILNRNCGWLRWSNRIVGRGNSRCRDEFLESGGGKYEKKVIRGVAGITVVREGCRAGPKEYRQAEE